MALTGSRTYVGFGFGAIQAGLFLYEAFQSGNFGRLVVAEVVPDVVAAIRRAGGHYTVNIAQADRVEQADVGPVELEDPASEADRRRLIEAIAAAEEIGTAIPSVAYYTSAGPGSLHRLLAAGLRLKVTQNGPRAVIYAAENHNHAAEILQEQVFAEIPAEERAAVGAQVRFLNTVIGKMSGVVTDPAEIDSQGLARTTADSDRAFLVEAFNRILISQIRFDGEPPFRRGIEVFEEKSELLPFEEAKLYGHNATHALAAYLAAVRGVDFIADLRATPDIIDFLRAAFIEESGAALIHKYAGFDPLFTGEGYRWYANDLLVRMTNPFLHDSVERVGRDPQRKLGWDDRLIGTIRLALQQNVEPRRYAVGAAAALVTLDRTALDSAKPVADWLVPLWQPAAPATGEQTAVLELIEMGRTLLKRWIESGFSDLEGILLEIYQ